MPRLVPCWIAAVVLALGSVVSWSQEPAPVDLDSGFGNDGYVPVPQASGAAPGSVSLGFVALPQAGGYMMFSAQLFNGTPSIVGSRIRDNGTVDTAFGTNGSISYSLPIPDGVAGGEFDRIQVRAVVVVQGGIETIHLVYKFSTNFVAVARISTQGALIDFAASNMPVHFGAGAGAIRDVIFLPNVRMGFNGLLLALQGNSTDVDKFVLIKYEGGSFYENFGTSFNTLNLRVHRINLRSDGLVDVVGTGASMAYFSLYRPVTNQLGDARFFSLPCTTSMAVASAIDDIVRDAPLGLEPLVIGRSQCLGGGYEMIAARVSSIDTAPIATGLVRIADDVGDCTTMTDRCLTMALASQGQSGRIYVVTPALELAILDLQGGTGAPQLSATYTMQISNAEGPLFVLPTRRFGWYQGYPALTGIGVRPADISFGMSRVFVASLLTDGFED